MAHGTQLLIFGDYQTGTCFKTYGFGTLLNQKFAGDADIMLRKFAGYPTEWVKSVASCCMRNLSFSPEKIILVLGNDDVLRHKKGSGYNTNLDFNQLQKNLKSICTKLMDECDMRREDLIILSPFPVDEGRFQAYEQNRFNGLKLEAANVAKLTDCYKVVASKFGAAFIDTTQLLDKNLDGNLKKDGYMLTPAGHQLVFDELMKYITSVQDSIFPEAEDVKGIEHLNKVALDSCIFAPDNLSAHTSLGSKEEYCAFFSKTYSGKL